MRNGAGTSASFQSVGRYLSISRNLTFKKRVTKSPKLHFLDAGLLAALRGLTPQRLRLDRTRFGSALETFVFGEILKLAGWAEDRYALSHFRDKERNEVDIVIEDGRGRIVGIEVKASATVTGRDFSGLRRLAVATGDRFVQGLVLYDHEQTVPFGDRLAAAPVSALWSWWPNRFVDVAPRPLAEDYRLVAHLSPASSASSLSSPADVQPISAHRSPYPPIPVSCRQRHAMEMACRGSLSCSPISVICLVFLDLEPLHDAGPPGVIRCAIANVSQTSIRGLAKPNDHGRTDLHRVDAEHLEPGDRVYEAERRLRQLLRRTIRRTVSGRRRTPLRARVRSDASTRTG